MRVHCSNLTLSIAVTLLAAACSGTAEPPGAAAVAARAEPAHSPTFINRVWRVTESPSVARGTLYVFLSDGTLLITSEQSTPMVGTWKHEGGILTMVEESIPYKVDILNLSADEFRIRSHNPGGAVELRLVPAQ